MYTNVIILASVSAILAAESGPTRSPVVAPDAESVISVESPSFPTIHHSDLHLGKLASSNESKSSNPTSPPVSDAEVHHSDIYMTKNERKSEFVRHYTRNQERATTPAYITEIERDVKILSTAKPKAHPPVATDDVHSLEEKSSSEEDRSTVDKSKDTREKKHDHSEEHERKVIDHAPIATERHPPKPVSAHHPSLSKHWDSLSGAHAPIAFSHHNNPTIEHGHRNGTIHDHNSSNNANRQPDKYSTIQHAPMAREHHGSKMSVAHHPSLSKQVNLPRNDSNPAPAIQSSHVHVDPSTDETSAVVNASSVSPSSEHNRMTGAAHHPSLSKGDLLPNRGNVPQRLRN